MNKFAIVTGASSGIGLELAKLAQANGYDVLLAADTPFTDQFDSTTRVETLEVDLASFDGVDKLLDAAQGRQIDVLCANAGHGLGRAFLDQDPDEWLHVIDTNVTGTAYLLQKVLRHMTGRGEGKVLVTGSVAGFIPGSFQAVYNGTKAFVDNFTEALRNELKDHKGIQLTTLLPGPVDTEFFERGDMLDTQVGADPHKADPADVAKDGWNALMAGDARKVSGMMNKLQVGMSGLMPQSQLAEQHRKMAEPGTAKS